MAALGDGLSINFYLFALGARYVTCPWLKLGLCQTLELVIITEFISELHTNVPAGQFRERNCPCSRIINQPDAQ